MGAFATAFLLYGMALVYGAVGTTSLVQIQARLVSGNLGLLTVGTFMMIAAFAFKVAAVPFHMWTPDAYQGAPTPVTAFMSAGAKAAGFAALVRLALLVLANVHANWTAALSWIAILTMTIGNVTALFQTNVKRM